MNFVPPLLLDVPQHGKSQNRIFFAFSPVFSPNEFLSNFLEENTDENRHGELSEWSKVQHSKSPSANGSKTSEKPLTVRISGIRPPQAHREF